MAESGSDQPKTVAVYRGSKFSIELLLKGDGSSPVGEFLNSLPTSDRKKVDTLFELMGEKGRITNDQKFKKLEGSNKIFEFKSFQVRLLCFFAGSGRLVVCKGLIKKRDRHDRQDIEFAESCREKFIGA